MRCNLITMNACFLFILLGYLPNTQAGDDKLSCALKSEQIFLGGLPNFQHNSAPLQGVQCQLNPYYSGFLGNWFPSLPQVQVSQSSRLLPSKKKTDSASGDATDDDASKTWKIALSIKRFGRSQISILSGQKEWQQVLQATKSINFLPSGAKSTNDVILIADKKQARLKHEEKYYGVGLILPFQDEQILTELRVQKSIINQPIQANVSPFENHSLFTAQVEIDEIMIASQSSNNGLNINWHIGLGQGNITLEPKNLITFKSELDQVISLRGQLEFYYQYRINRKWFGHAGWKGEVHYWQQGNSDDNFQLANANNIRHQAFFGLGVNF